jgi:hypothetical protein
MSMYKAEISFLNLNLKETWHCKMCQIFTQEDYKETPPQVVKSHYWHGRKLRFYDTTTLL